MYNILRIQDCPWCS